MKETAFGVIKDGVLNAHSHVIDISVPLVALPAIRLGKRLSVIAATASEKRDFVSRKASFSEQTGSALHLQHSLAMHGNGPVLRAD